MTKTRSPLITLDAALALTLILNVPTSADTNPAPNQSGSPTLSLDTSPSFDFGDDPAVDPLFAPSTLGLSNGVAGFERVAALSAWATAARQAFPPSHEVFLAYWGNPRYALLPGAVPGAGSPLSLASAFRLGGGAEANVVPGRTAVWSAEKNTEVIVGGLLYQLPGAQKYVSPLVLDLVDGRLNASRGEWRPHPAQLTGPYVAFDMDGDGFQDITEWLTPQDGLLTTSPNPTSGRDLLGTAGGWRNGFEHLLALYDLDGDGTIHSDELISGPPLYVWRDWNTNGVAETNEVLPSARYNLAAFEIPRDPSQPGGWWFNCGDFDCRVAMMWDWWPNFALANRRAASPAGTGLPLVGLDAMAAIRNILFGRVVDDNNLPRTSGLVGPQHIPLEQLAAASIDLETFRMALLADGGRIIIGFDTITSLNGLSRARLLEIRLDYARIWKVPLPFEEIYQLACNPSGRMVLVLGDHGSKMAVVDFDTGTVTPPEGLELQSVGLRASGVAGDPAIRYTGPGYFWFSGWQLNEQGEVVDECVWAITPWGFWRGQSLDALRKDMGPLGQYYLTGAQSGFFVTPTPGGTNETLWWINSSGSDTCRVAIAQADAFGGMHAVCGGAQGAGGALGAVAYTKRTGDQYVFSFFDVFTEVSIDLFTNREPLFYPFLTDGGGTAIAAQLDPATGTINYLGSSETDVVHRTNTKPILSADPGQGKVSRGAFAHYGTNGIDILPVPDEPAPRLPSQVWSYCLLPGSRLTDACPVCGRPDIVVPMHGTFLLRLLEENPLFSTYAIENLALDAGGPPGTTYEVRGKGVFHIGGEVGVLQDMFLEVRIESNFTNRVCYFTNRTSAVDRLWPMIHITLDQTNGLELQTFTLELNAAPLRDLWFSTVNGMTPANWNPPTNHVSPGDLVSFTGRMVKRNQELTARLGFQPSPNPPDLGLDAVDVRPGGDIVFSLEQDAFSETLEWLHHGDLLAASGHIVARNLDMMAAFKILSPLFDFGLDAVQVRADDEIYFSIETDIVSGTGLSLGHGDLLSNRGVVVKSNAQLLARFHPADPKKDYGLDALYVWPSGEIWFSLEEGFQDQALGPILSGDLLSDQGYVVYRNLDLVAGFAPIEDLADFGLDALYVVFGNVLRLDLTRSDSKLVISWDAPEAVLQEADAVTGPWQDVSPDPLPSPYEVPSPSGTKFYRLREP